MEAMPAAGGAGGLFVDTSTLESTAASLAGLGGELAALAKAPSISAGSLGAGSLEGTLHDFFTEWGYAVSKMESNLNNVISNMHAAAVQYDKSEGIVSNGAQW